METKEIKISALINTLIGIGGGLIGLLLIGIFFEFNLFAFYYSIIGGLILSILT